MAIRLDKHILGNGKLVGEFFHRGCDSGDFIILSWRNVAHAMLIRPQTCLPLFEDLALRSAVEFRSTALLFKCLPFCRFLCRGSFCCGFIFFIEVLRFLSPSHSINNIRINWMIGCWRRSTLISTGKNKYISNSNELSPPSSSPSQVATIVFASPQISGLAAC